MHNERLYLLEILRFVAAFTIMYGHFIVHYLYFGIDPDIGFFPKYVNPYGSLAVPFFFMMSGAIFAMKYGKVILNQEISFHNFTLRRIARLYPLHLLTLIVVAITQYFIFNIEAKYYYIENNDLYHFILNLFFASDWGFQSGNSFNSPFWSVSHEFLIYILFFYVCKTSFLSQKPIWQKYLFFMFLIFILRHAEAHGYINLIIFKIPVYDLILQSIFTFFGGALMFEFFLYLNSLKKKLKIILFLITFIILYLISTKIKNEGIPFGSLGYAILLFALLLDFNYREGFSSIYERIAQFLGGISYSIYLIHMPVIFIMGLFQINYKFFDLLGPYSVMLYLLISLSLGSISFQFFEKPIQKIILKKFSK